jgi:hypothetical protein
MSIDGGDAALLITVGERLLELAITLLGADTVQAKLDAQFAAADAAAELREREKFKSSPEAVTTPETPDAKKDG